MFRGVSDDKVCHWFARIDGDPVIDKKSFDSVIAVKEAQTLRPPRGSCGVPFAISPQRKEADTHAKKQQEKSAKLRRLLNVIYNSSRFVRQPRVY